MVHAISWTDFLIAITAFTLCWYGLVALIIFRQNAAKTSRERSAKSDTGSPLAITNDPENNNPPEAGDMIGAIRMPEGLESVSMNGFGFADSGTTDEQLGLIPDVLKDLREIFAIIEKEDGSKHDFFSLVGIVKDKYPAIRTTGRLPEINAFITRNAPFFLSPEEIENLW